MFSAGVCTASKPVQHVKAHSNAALYNTDYGKAHTAIGLSLNYSNTLH